jgi:SNF2 family DNA or RNA helicase
MQSKTHKFQGVYATIHGGKLISKDAIQRYLERELNDWNWVKSKPKKDMEDELSFYKFKTTPYKHQLDSTLIGALNDNFLYLLEMGLGKTKIILDVLQILKHKWNRCLVPSPNASTMSTWTDEVSKHSNLTSLELVGTTPERWGTLNSSSEQLVLLNYTGLLVMNTDKIHNKWVINHNKLRNFIKQFDAVVYDEIHLNKNHRSLTFEICKFISRKVKLRYGLTGTPINRDPLSLWSQFYLIDLGETLGNLSFYRESMFKQWRNYWGGIEYSFRKEFEPQLNKWLSNKSIRYAKADVLELPEKNFITQSITLADEARKFYLPNYQILVANEEYAELKTTFMKLRQVCSGFLYDEGETLRLKTNKIDTLIDLINSTPPDDKVVVFVDFVESGSLISEALKKEKIKHERLYGGTKDKGSVKNKFITDPKCKVLVANIKSGGTGMNLQAANYVIMYELPISSIDYTQAIERCHRPGQNKKVFIYNFITKGTVEERIMGFIQEGRDVFKSLIEGIKKSKKSLDI